MLGLHINEHKIGQGQRKCWKTYLKENPKIAIRNRNAAILQNAGVIVRKSYDGRWHLDPEQAAIDQIEDQASNTERGSNTYYNKLVKRSS